MQKQRWVSEQGPAHLKISWIKYHINQKDSVITYTPPIMPDLQKEPNHTPSGSKISPAVLFIIVILAILFFISGILHLLVRFLTKTPNSSSSQPNRSLEASNSSDVLQRQLQQLFHLHDSGLDQAFIDALPVFSYKEVVGPKEPFDCAVCLCEFSETDQLRLLPSCSHAFHINCIDTWLLSNSTCPLCRGALFNPGFPIENPVFDFDDFRDEDENRFVISQKRAEIDDVVEKKGVFSVRLGKFRKSDESENGVEIGETSSSKLDARRCYSMGSYQYVVGDANLRVALDQNRSKRDLGKETEQSCDALAGKKISIGAKTDSYSVSKIWMWSKKGKFASSSPGNNLDLPWMRRNEDI
ncbi:hypothetical protein CASFOL_026464 [Castilleja foliolosa]|uniref:RING-type E3 ubiquitin transferase n=1 Tax=Castilleja foliolosa TaxID=1961234 RepID=A0ABD3CID7_9LAMI